MKRTVEASHFSNAGHAGVLARLEGSGLRLRALSLMALRFRVSGLGLRVGVTMLRTVSRLEQVQGLGL